MTKKPSTEPTVEAPPPRDRALVLGELPEQKGVAVLRQRGDAPIEAGVVRPMREGEPLVGELVTLKPTEQGSRLCDVEVHVDARPKLHAGPSRVSTPAFREGWDAVFGKRAQPN